MLTSLFQIDNDEKNLSINIMMEMKNTANGVSQKSKNASYYFRVVLCFTFFICGNVYSQDRVIVIPFFGDDAANNFKGA
jgi:hypothetical protein